LPEGAYLASGGERAGVHPWILGPTGRLERGSDIWGSWREKVSFGCRLDTYLRMKSARYRISDTAISALFRTAESGVWPS